MSAINVKDLKRALLDAGLEVFRVREDEVHLAERQNVQLMEAGVRARAGEAPAITVVARAQRNDAPTMSAQSLFDLVRARMAALRDEGYLEVDAVAREIRSVSDPTHILDVWYEITLQRELSTLEDVIFEARRVIALDRYVTPGRT